MAISMLPSAPRCRPSSLDRAGHRFPGPAVPAATRAGEPYQGELPAEPLLSAAEERALAAAIARGESEARARLIRANLRLVVRIAREYQGRGLPLDDLVGEGTLGLIRAAQDFDPGYGVRFSTYAAHWIKQAIRQALITTAAPIRLPAHMVQLLNRWRRAERILRRRFDREPSFDEVATALALSDSHRLLVDRALQARRLVAEGPCGDRSETAWSAVQVLAPEVAPGEGLEQAEAHQDLIRRLERLEARERLVIVLRFGLDGAEPLTLKEVGRRLGITREWARKIEMKALQKLGDRPAAAGALSARRPQRWP